ncbi:uncharacterized protein N7459_008374 [Penicillium hispanicum]|uniref:uncharacterized protein n=1 Tax=Penicillium hispanicum TaxID=1080232 RepID=UPI00253FCEFB|nr:uncharacterized protein N7459_008374 [Penicillium hispanicum]KAJ5573947.1 hypothetical protein N7459_008374 [Penicillium hispanicum]
MPHTSRNKRSAIPAQKRLQVTADDGWTHVTSGSNVRRVLRTARVRNDNSIGIETAYSVTGTSATSQPNTNTTTTTIDEPVLGPAEAPSRLTLPELQDQYRGYRERWLGSETWAALAACLDERMRQRRDAAAQDSCAGAVDAIVCIGLGSPSGFLRDGWVDRRAVSMYQLAALESIKERISETLPTPTRHIPTYAQDPVFNALDHALLASCHITVLTHPSAFARVTPATLLFCPGAERKHLELVLPANPRLVFGGPLENADSTVIQGFVERTGSRALVPFGAHEHAFWMTRLYYQEEEKDGDEDGQVGN